MSARTRAILLAIALNAGAHAPSLPAGTPAAPETFRVITDEIEGPEQPRVTTCTLVVGTRHFFLEPPPGWAIKPEAAAKTLRFLPQDLAGGMSMRLVPAAEAGKFDGSEAELKRRAFQKYPKSKLLSETEAVTAEKPVRAIDLERRVDGKAVVRTRLILIPLADGGIMEFELTAQPKLIDSQSMAFARMVGSFRVVPREGAQTPGPSALQSPAPRL